MLESNYYNNVSWFPSGALITTVSGAVELEESGWFCFKNEKGIRSYHGPFKTEKLAWECLKTGVPANLSCTNIVIDYDGRYSDS